MAARIATLWQSPPRIIAALAQAPPAFHRNCMRTYGRGSIRRRIGVRSWRCIGIYNNLVSIRERGQVGIVMLLATLLLGEP